jgi:ribosome-binding protein aMBF1 (putative translation factor)
MSNPINFQDWTTVVLKKKEKKKQKQLEIDPIVKKMNQLDNTDDVCKIETVSNDDRKLITSLRTTRKITQEELAKMLNIKKEIIRDIENGSLAENKQMINKIKNFLLKKSI